jgi:hypothetical protein
MYEYYLIVATVDKKQPKRQTFVGTESDIEKWKSIKGLTEYGDGLWEYDVNGKDITFSTIKISPKTALEIVKNNNNNYMIGGIDWYGSYLKQSDEMYETIDYIPESIISLLEER